MTARVINASSWLKGFAAIVDTMDIVESVEIAESLDRVE
jgi:hypothetical protein